MREYWDIGEVAPFPNLGKTSTAKVMQALIKLGGQLHCTDVDAGVCVLYRISLPVGMKDDFEKLAGYPLTAPARIGAH